MVGKWHAANQSLEGMHCSKRVNHGKRAAFPELEKLLLDWIFEQQKKGVVKGGGIYGAADAPAWLEAARLETCPETGGGAEDVDGAIVEFSGTCGVALLLDVALLKIEGNGLRGGRLIKGGADGWGISGAAGGSANSRTVLTSEEILFVIKSFRMTRNEEISLLELQPPLIVCGDIHVRAHKSSAKQSTNVLGQPVVPPGSFVGKLESTLLSGDWMIWYLICLGLCLGSTDSEKTLSRDIFLCKACSDERIRMGTVRSKALDLGVILSILKHEVNDLKLHIFCTHGIQWCLRHQILRQVLKC
uniref:HTH CENPB-type domain-containing protein n=1 Tax=Romanomermis culicivorax TaxID=13658 RepID=A0A915JP53_ROMCU